MVGGSILGGEVQVGDGGLGLDGEVQGGVGDGLGVFVEAVGVAVRAGVGAFVDYGTANEAELVRGGVISDGGGHFFAVGLHGCQYSAGAGRVQACGGS